MSTKPAVIRRYVLSRPRRNLTERNDSRTTAAFYTTRIGLRNEACIDGEWVEVAFVSLTHAALRKLAGLAIRRALGKPRAKKVRRR
jgi:hypothetical protein